MLLAASERFGNKNVVELCYFDSNGNLNIYQIEINPGGYTWAGGPPQPNFQSIAFPNAPIAISQQFGLTQTDIFFVDTNGNMNVVYCLADGTWGGPVLMSQDGGFYYSPRGNIPINLAVSQQFGADKTDVFAIDLNGQLNIFWVTTDGSWNTKKIGPNIFWQGTPLAASRQANYNQTDVFVTDVYGTIWVFFVLDQGNWAGPHQIGPVALGGGVGGGASDHALPLYGPNGMGWPMAASPRFGTDQTDVFTFGADGLHVLWVNKLGNWHGPTTIVATTELNQLTPQIAVARQRSNQTDVFFLLNNALNVCWAGTEGKWSAPVQIGSASDFVPGGFTALQRSFGTQTDLFVLGKSGEIYCYQVYLDYSWTGPITLPPPP
jgi:hypothetical protein